MAESFFATLRAELVDHETYATARVAERSIGDYIECVFDGTSPLDRCGQSKVNPRVAVVAGQHDGCDPHIGEGGIGHIIAHQPAQLFEDQTFNTFERRLGGLPTVAAYRDTPRTVLVATTPHVRLRPMAGPTLKDVLDAIAKLTTRVGRDVATKADLAKLATKSDLAALDTKVDKRFDRVEKQLAEIGKDLDGHMTVHRKLEEDITRLKGRPPRSAARPEVS